MHSLSAKQKYFYMHTEAYVPWKTYLENKGDLWKPATLQTGILLHCFKITHSRQFMTHLVKQTHIFENKSKQ